MGNISLNLCVGGSNHVMSCPEWLKSAEWQYPGAFLLQYMVVTIIEAPKHIQHDQRTNFVSGVFQEVIAGLGISQALSSACHPVIVSRDFGACPPNLENCAEDVLCTVS